jgi:hypothetical protein
MNRKLVFYSILDFYPRRNEIKTVYKSLSISDKKAYKHYVYSICFEKEYVKDLMWEYLNDWEESYIKLIDEYIIKRKKQKSNEEKKN